MIIKLRNWMNINKFNQQLLSLNLNSIELLSNNQDKINWNFLSKNSNAIKFLKENKNNIDWNLLSLNLNAIELLKDNPDKISIGALTFADRSLSSKQLTMTTNKGRVTKKNGVN